MTTSKKSKEEFNALCDLLNGYFDGDESNEGPSAFARRVGVSRNIISGIRNGTYESSPTLDVVLRILDGIGCDLTDLVGVGV